MADAKRVARLIGQARAVQRQLEVAHVLGHLAVAAEAGAAELAAAERLVLQHFGRERALVRPARGRAQRGDGGQVAGAGGRGGLEQFAGPGQRRLAPGAGHGLDVEVGLGHLRHPLRAQFGQPRVDPAGDAAEVGVAGIAQSQHGVLQFRELGCAAAGQELDEADRIVGRIALALGADHHVEQAFAGQLAGGIGIGAQQAGGQPGGLGLVEQHLGGAPGIAGLAAVEDGQPLARPGGGLGARGAARGGDRAGAAGQAGGIARQPPQPGRLQPLGQADECVGRLLGKRKRGQCGGCGHPPAILGWRSWSKATGHPGAAGKEGRLCSHALR